jgi:cytidylate kinase
VLADCPTALHVRLDGDPGRRARQAAALGSISVHKASVMADKYDRMFASYIRRFYHADPADSRHYHLTLDSTRLSFETCAEVIVVAAQTRQAG